LITFVVIDFQIVGGAMGAFVIPTLAAQGSPTEPPPALGIVFMLGMLAQLLGSAFIAYTTLRRRPVPVAVGWLWAASLLVEIASMVPGAGFLDALSGVLAMSALIVSGASLAGAGRRDAATHPSPTAAKA
ncbi:MAG: hypothetical protein HOQ07_03925, partial [Sinomonas sp.]|nr:hypothetical protein [Sinomonas sp.]